MSGFDVKYKVYSLFIISRLSFRVSYNEISKLY